jgi:hypothetical protein
VSEFDTIYIPKKNQAIGAFSELVVHLGKEGWEVVAFDPEYVAYLFKRPILD